MSNVRILSIAMLTAITVKTMSQPATNGQQATSQQQDTGKHSPMPSLFGGVGVVYYNGTIGHGSNVTAYSTVRTAYTFGIEYRPVNFLGLQLNGEIGKLASSERSTSPDSNLNFQANFAQGELIVNLHLDGLLLKPNSIISPFIFTGFSFMSYTSYADTRDAKGEPYYYWTDGSIRNLPQNAADVYQALQEPNDGVIQRSYNYDSLLGSGTTECVPVGLGAKIRLTDNLFVNIQAAYYFTFSDNLEQWKTLKPTQNDKYLFSFFTLEYNFRKNSQTENAEAHRYDTIDMSGIITTDTIKKNEMTAEQEKAYEAQIAAKSATVDTSSMSHDEAMGREKRFFNADPKLQQHIIDSINNARLNPPKKGGVAVTRKPIPDRLKWIDKNNDGYITSQEISQAIDDFFNGTAQGTIEDINNAIDFFFDQ